MIIYACSGGSNLGQLSNDVAKGLSMEGKGRMSCLAGVGAHVSTIVESGRAASDVLAIDGCGLCCAKKALEHVGITVTRHVVLTDLGIEKSYDLSRCDEHIEKVRRLVTGRIA